MLWRTTKPSGLSLADHVPVKPARAPEQPGSRGPSGCWAPERLFVRLAPVTHVVQKAHVSHDQCMQTLQVACGTHQAPCASGGLQAA